MAKKKTNKALHHSLVIASILLVIVVIFVGIIALIQYKPSSGNTNTQSDDTNNGQSVRITGTILCLPHKDTSGPQTMECAYGLKDEAGKYYGLSDTDPTYQNISGVPMNEKVTVTGTIEKQTSAIYPIESRIDVTKIER